MAPDKNARVAALQRLRDNLESHIKKGTPASDLTLARIRDLCSAALTGEATQAVINKLADPERGAGANKKKASEEVIELIDIAINALEHEAIDKLVRPGVAAQDLYFQGVVAQALASNSWVRWSFIALVTAYLLALGLLIYPISNAFDQAGQAGKLLLEAQQRVQLTAQQLNEATHLVREAEGRIEGFREDYGLVQERLNAISDEVAGIETVIERRKSAFDQEIAAIEQTVRNNAADANRRISAVPREVTDRVESVVGVTENFANEQLSKLEGLDNRIEGIDARMSEFEGAIERHENDLDGAIDETLAKLFAGRDETVDTMINQRVSAITGPHLKRLSEWTIDQERKFINEVEILQNRRATLGMRFAELEKNAGELERQRNNVELKYGTLEQTSLRIAQVEDRVRELIGEIAPIQQLAASLRERAEPVGQLLGQAMSLSNREIADQLWLTIKTNYAIFSLFVISGFFLVWLGLLTYKQWAAKPDR